MPITLSPIAFSKACRRALIVALLAITTPAIVKAHPMKTRTLAEATAPARPITICQAGWLAGHWVFSDQTTMSEEIWSPPIGKAIMGSFRTIRSGDVGFYEIMVITEDKGALALQLRHFHPADLSGWDQENGKAVTHQLVDWDATTLYFDGLTFEGVNPDLLRVHLRVVDPATKQASEKHFDYRKVSHLASVQPCS